MLDLHLLLYAGMLGGGGGGVNALEEVIAASESKRLHNIGIPPFLLNAACYPISAKRCVRGFFLRIDRQLGFTSLHLLTNVRSAMICKRCCKKYGVKQY